jgi:hypothetical protein
MSVADDLVDGAKVALLDIDAAAAVDTPPWGRRLRLRRP